jgi:carboxylesterase type B
MLRLLTLATLFASAIALPVLDSESASPTVGIKNGTIVGSSFDGVDSFLGIPFAKPPTGTLRLKPPQQIDTSWGTLVATSSPTACPQMIIPPQSPSSGPASPTPSPQGEDCLTINVQRPSNVMHGKKLPVLFWIFGGGFEIGASQQYNASVIVQESSGLGEGIVFVAVNYRLNGFGFLAGKELQKDGSTNLGLRDQRAGLRWVAENIEGNKINPFQRDI